MEPQTAGEPLKNVDAETAANIEADRVRPSWMRYFRACTQLLERSVAPTLSAIAKELGVSPQAVWALQKRHPELLEWIHQQFVQRNKNLFGPVQYRLALLAMQGSTAHTDLYLKSLTMGFGTMDPQASSSAGGPIVVQQNFLVPRPEYPKLEEPKPVPRAMTGADIPTVVVR